MKSRALPVLLATIVFYVIVSVIPDKKIAFSAVMAYVAVISWMLKNIPFGLVVSYIALVPLSIGKFIPIDLVSAQQLHIYGRPFGVSANIAITSRDVLCAGMSIILLWRSIRRRTIYYPTDMLGWALLVYPIAIGVATYFGSIRSEISWLHVIPFIEPFIVYMFITYVVKGADYIVLVAVAIAAIGSESVLVLLQHVHGGPLGLVIEDFPSFTPIETSSDPTTIMLRVGGTFAHANILAQYLIFFLFVTVPLVFESTSILTAPTLFCLYIGMFVLMLTMSRSAWAAWIVGLGIFLYYARTLRIRFPLAHYNKLLFWFAAIVLLVSAWLLVIPRFIGSVHTFGPDGSGQSRQQLYALATSVILSHPIFGVGLYMDVYYTMVHARDLGPAAAILKDFPEPVHNGLVQLFEQVGIVGFVPFAMILVGLLGRLRRHIVRGKKNRIYMAGILAGAFAWLVNGQLQPMLPDLSVLIIFILCWEQSVGYDLRHNP